MSDSLGSIGIIWWINSPNGLNAIPYLCKIRGLSREPLLMVSSPAKVSCYNCTQIRVGTSMVPCSKVSVQVTKTRTTPYRPCSNGQVERYSRTILVMIRCYLDKDQRNWDDDLQLLASTYHSTVNRQTCFTPNRLMHGREVLQPVDVMLGMTEANLSNLFSHEYVNHLAHTLPQLYELVRTNL